MSRTSRRELLRGGALATLGALLPAGLAQAVAARPDLLPHVTALVERWVGPGRFPGLVASLGQPGGPAQFVARGTDSFTDLDPVTPESLFRIYSMTKPVTGMAAMLLIDEGRLRLDQPVADILPAFARMQVLDDPDGPLDRVRPARSPITIRQLVTHTAGLAYAIVQTGPIRQRMLDQGLVGAIISRVPIPALDHGVAAGSLATFADRLAALPLVYQPGTRWSYSLGLDLMGRVIEVVSGRPFDAFLRERLFDPLGMAGTSFRVAARDARRLTTNHAVVARTLVPLDPGATSIYLDPPPFPMGGAGLVSSPHDYDRFLHMLAAEGRLGGTRVMRQAAVRMGTSNLLPPGVAGPDGAGFGAGGRVGLGPQPTFGWAGAAGTVGTVDMGTGVRSQLFSQFMPPGALPILDEYAAALRADVTALMKRRT